MKNTLQPVSLKKFLELCEDGKRRELIRGEVLEMPPARAQHGSFTDNINYAINQFVRPRQLGRVFAAETGFLLERNPDTLRAADCAFVRWDRLPTPIPDEYLFLAPDLVVETLSGDDRPGKVQEKIDQWLESGVRMVWVIDPKKRTVTVHHPRHQGVPPKILKAGDFLDGEDILPGFTLAVEEIFA